MSHLWHFSIVTILLSLESSHSGDHFDSKIMVFRECHICDTFQLSQYYHHWNRHILAIILIVKLWCLKSVTFVTPFNSHNIIIIRIVTFWRSFWYQFHVIWRMWQKSLCVIWYFVTNFSVRGSLGWYEMDTGWCHHFWNRCDTCWSRGFRCNHDAGYIQWHIPSDEKCW